MRFIQELEETQNLVRTWSGKFRICEDRKKIRDKCLSDFTKAYTNYDKLVNAGAKTAKAAENIRTKEQAAKIELSRLDS